jgi:hypothetical protein
MFKILKELIFGFLRICEIVDLQIAALSDNKRSEYIVYESLNS